MEMTLEMKFSASQVKTLMGRLINRMYALEMLGMIEDKVETLDHIVNANNRFMKNNDITKEEIEDIRKKIKYLYYELGRREEYDTKIIRYIFYQSHRKKFSICR